MERELEVKPPMLARVFFYVAKNGSTLTLVRYE